ncbi:hypothetical protein [Streptomyces sp. NPDC058451]|uniref:hypothetical protein n=1 Tax=Streptomyces sp. NPDC058451 TaxID=3346506 RepID=UPI003666A8D5
MADPGRRFDDLFNFVHDPATLLVAFDRVAGNQGARSPGVDGLTAIDVEESIGVPGFLNDLRAALKDGSFRTSVWAAARAPHSLGRDRDDTQIAVEAPPSFTGPAARVLTDTRMIVFPWRRSVANH